jgi:hypothetical protein
MRDVAAPSLDAAIPQRLHQEAVGAAGVKHPTWPQAVHDPVGYSAKEATPMWLFPPIDEAAAMRGIVRGVVGFLGGCNDPSRMVRHCGASVDSRKMDAAA